MPRLVLLTVILTASAALLRFAATSPVEACAIARVTGADLDLSTERVVIIWDEENQRQHFIRDAEFHGDGQAFGFLVPSPSLPELHEANERLIPTLRDRSAPREVPENEYTLGTCCTLSLLSSGSDQSTGPLERSLVLPGVSVVSTQRVGQLDASILRVNDPASLPAWLADNGFAVEESITEWVAPYAASGHYITAFKFDPESAEGFRTGAIRISFDTDRPFYPYREPSTEGADEEQERWLRVFFLASERASGRVSGADFGTTYFAAAVPGLHAGMSELADFGVGDDTWLTVFDDRTSRRPDADVFFDVEAGDELRPDPIAYSNPVVIPIPFEIILPLGLVWWWRRRRKAAA